MRPVTECDTRLRAARIDVHKFQSTHSITECDNDPSRPMLLARYFNPRTPLQSATGLVWGWLNWRLFQSTHSITECDGIFPFAPKCFFAISIHALHYRVRRPDVSKATRRHAISIHALHYRVRLLPVDLFLLPI